MFNAGKEIEAMKRLMLHRIASLLYYFITSSSSFEADSLWFITYCNQDWNINVPGADANPL